METRQGKEGKMYGTFEATTRILVYAILKHVCIALVVGHKLVFCIIFLGWHQVG